MVKKREGYRPFAPSVLQERMREFFDLPARTESAAYMTIVVPVQPQMRPLLGAITHVDGTARIQTVTRAENPRYYALIEAFARLTGVPIVLNTSLNNNAEPIVDSVDDAVTCFLTTGINALIVGDWVVEKRPDIAREAKFLALLPAVPSSRKLAAAEFAAGPARYSLLSIAHDVFGEACIEISGDLYRVLLDADDCATVRGRCERLEIIDDLRLDRLRAELFDVWQRRGISLRAGSA
jgi:carbamoyltransferase